MMGRNRVLFVLDMIASGSQGWVYLDSFVLVRGTMESTASAPQVIDRLDLLVFRADLAQPTRVKENSHRQEISNIIKRSLDIQVS
jgi:hypothetical protein